jgi:hypothetical protein
MIPVYSEVGLDSFLFYVDTFNNDPLRNAIDSSSNCKIAKSIMKIIVLLIVDYRFHWKYLYVQGLLKISKVKNKKLLTNMSNTQRSIVCERI